jgi:hypothetical protein
MSIYHRPELAAKMAQQLLHPGVLDEGLRSGLFLSGLRRTGKTTFLTADLIPALESEGAVVIYVDLWSDVQMPPSDLVQRAIRGTLKDLQSPASALWKKLQRVTKLELAAHGLTFKFELDRLGASDGATLAEALTAVVDQARTDVVLIVDEVQHALGTDNGTEMLLALKAARDAINARPATPGHFIFVGTGSHRAFVNELVARRNQAFAGATSVPYPVLGGDFVEHVLTRLAQESSEPLPSVAGAVAAFKVVGHRPEELVKALRLLRADEAIGLAPDTHLGVIATALRTSAADVELVRLEELGGLAGAIFERIATTEGDTRGLFSAEAAAAYSAALGRTVPIEEIQPAVNALVSSNIVMRRGHGAYAVADAFVAETWLERRRLTAPP